MVINNAEHLALRGVVGSDVDGLIVGPAQQSDSNQNIKTDGELLHGEILLPPVYRGRLRSRACGRNFRRGRQQACFKPYPFAVHQVKG